MPLEESEIPNTAPDGGDIALRCPRPRPAGGTKGACHAMLPQLRRNPARTAQRGAVPTELRGGAEMRPSHRGHVFLA